MLRVKSDHGCQFGRSCHENTRRKKRSIFRGGRALRLLYYGTEMGSQSLRRPLACVCVLAGLFLGFPVRAAAPKPAAPRADSATETVVRLQIDGEIEPILAEYIVNGIEQAARDHASLILITINTPGGLDTSMRQIIQAILQFARAGGHLRVSHGFARGFGRIFHFALGGCRRHVAWNGHRRGFADHGSWRAAGSD